MDQNKSVDTILSTKGSPERFFLVPQNHALPVGDFSIQTLDGSTQTVLEESVEQFEVTRDHALHWAKDELGHSLEELKEVIDDKLADWRRQLGQFKKTPVSSDTKVTSEAATTFFDFLRQLPEVVRDSVSGDEKRVDAASAAMSDLNRRFQKAGLPSNERLSNFPDRMAQAGSPKTPEK